MGESLLLKGTTACIVLLVLCTGGIPSVASEQKRSERPLNGDWLYVGGTGPNNYTTIQDAVDNTSDGDTVYVYHGTYTEYVVLSKSIHLLGEDKNITVISGFFAYTLCILADWVTVSGFTIYTNGLRGEGIRIDSCFAQFTNNIIDAPRDRIRVAGANNTVSDNLIKNCYLFVSGDGNAITGNTIINVYFGIALTGYAADNVLANNVLFSCGLLLSDATVGTNTVTDNTVNGRPLIYKEDASDETLGNEAGQVILFRCANITVQNQMILNTTVGIQLWMSTACTIAGNTLVGNHYGISLYGHDNTIEGNTITDGYYGVFLTGDNNSLSANVLARNNGTGIYLQHSSDNLLAANTITQDNYGIMVDYGSIGNTILGNTFAGNTHPLIVLSGTSETAILGNDITGNAGDGIDLSWSSSDFISGNSITDNVGCGITLSHCDHTTIVNCTVANNTDAGIVMASSDENQIINATVLHNQGDGVLIDDGAFDLVSASMIAHNGKDGICVVGERMTISGNTITDQDHGIMASGQGDHLIMGNSISMDVACGVFLNASSRNVLSNNTIAQENRGMYLVASSNNSVTYNTFQYNTRHALFDSCSNTWDHNYWGRPRVLPKLILGRQSGGTRPLLLIDIDWHPSLKPFGAAVGLG